MKTLSYLEINSWESLISCFSESGNITRYARTASANSWTEAYDRIIEKAS